MKFVISTQELHYLVSKCQNVVSGKSTMPILSNLLIEAKGDEIILTATDLTVGVKCFTQAKVLEEGATTIPAKTFSSLLRELTSTNLEVTTNENDITEINADSSKFKIHGMSKAGFPALPDLQEAVSLVLPQKELKDTLYRTSFAVSKEDNRYALTGVFMHIENGKAKFVGTDGKRLARSEIEVNIDPSVVGSYIIPLKAVEEILKSLKDEGEAKISFMPDKIAVESSDTILVTKLLSGDYPDVSRVIPEKPEAVVTLHREELMTLLRQVSLFTGVSSHSVRFTFSDGDLKLTANTNQVGEGNVSMPVNFSGPKLDIAFNPHFFLDILRHSNGETVSMGLIDAFNPGIITDQKDAQTVSGDTNPLFVLMPMRLNES